MERSSTTRELPLAPHVFSLWSNTTVNSLPFFASLFYLFPACFSLSFSLPPFLTLSLSLSPSPFLPSTLSLFFLRLPLSFSASLPVFAARHRLKCPLLFLVWSLAASLSRASNELNIVGLSRPDELPSHAENWAPRSTWLSVPLQNTMILTTVLAHTHTLHSIQRNIAHLPLGCACLLSVIRTLARHSRIVSAHADRFATDGEKTLG